jgi:hypothetical protein
MESHIDASPQSKPRTRQSRASFLATLVGVQLIVIGLVVAVVQALEPGPEIAAGLFSISYAGPLLIGIGVAVVGFSRIPSVGPYSAAGQSGIMQAGRMLLHFGVVAIIATSVYLVAGPGLDRGDGDDAAAALILSDGVDRSRLPRDQALALGRLAWGRSDAIDHNAGHDHGGSDTPPAELTAEQTVALTAQLDIARRVVPLYDTLDEAEAAGYVRSSSDSDGAGAHWINWSLVDRPFDPEAPSQLLFDELRFGEKPELIAFSYWVTSPEAPEGFAGDTDRWHQHLGMCFENGWLVLEGVQDAALCNGDWINGNDLWMLHAWVVPGVENRLGQFASVNPLLCERTCGLEN